MLEVLILAALGVWLALALRSCLRRRGKGCGGRSEEHTSELQSQ